MNTTTDRFLWLYDQMLIRDLVRNARDLANKAKMSPGNVTNIRKGRNKLGSSDADKFLAAFPEINREWFHTGTGEPFNEFTKPEDELRALERLMAKYGLKTLGQQIVELKKLMEQGVITKAEFQVGKRKILR